MCAPVNNLKMIEIQKKIWEIFTKKQVERSALGNSRQNFLEISNISFDFSRKFN